MTSPVELLLMLMLLLMLLLLLLLLHRACVSDGIGPPHVCALNVLYTSSTIRSIYMSGGCIVPAGRAQLCLRHRMNSTVFVSAAAVGGFECPCEV